MPASTPHTPHTLCTPDSSEAGASAAVPHREAPQVSSPSAAPQAAAPTAEDPLFVTGGADPSRRRRLLRRGSA